MHRKVELPIKPTDKVLEIGAGDQPHARTSLIVDKFVGEDSGWAQRGHREIVIDRPFVKADACQLPFPDKSFDYVLASHVIEHIPTDNLHLFISEIMRVGTAGYIEAPSVLFESVMDVTEHHSIIACIGNRLYACAKERSCISPLLRFFKPMFRFDPSFWHWNVERYDDLWLTGMEWKGSIDYAILDSASDILSLYQESDIVAFIKKTSETTGGEGRADPKRLSRIVRKAAQALRKPGAVLFGRTKAASYNRVVWREVVVCPICHSTLIEDCGALRCSECLMEFSILNGDIPALIA